MPRFRYAEDRVPVILMFLFSILDFCIYMTVDVWWFPVLWMGRTIVPRGWICARNHHHQHAATFEGVWMNRVLEVILGFHTGVTSHTWFLHHVVGHHKNYLDQTKDESRWKRADGSTMGELAYSLDVALTSYWRAWQTGATVPKQRAIFLRMAVLQLVLLGALFWHNWYNALFLYALPMWISLWGTAWATYFHHAGLDTKDPYQASYNVTDRWYNLFTGNLGLHTAHHLRPAVHWSRLPELHASIADKIPAELYREPGLPYRWRHADRKVREVAEGVPTN